MWIARTDENGTPLRPPVSVTPGFDADVVANVRGWGSDWRAIADEEKAALEAPTAEETLEILQKEFTDAIQKRLDDFARTRNYDDTDSMAKYLGCSVPKFAAEAACMRDAVAGTWAKSYEILNAVLAGQRPMPTLEEVFAELPVLAWPDEAHA